MLARNWRSPLRSHRGEIDLILSGGATIVFCEVKARRDADHGDAGLRVDADKQHRVRTLARLWIIDQHLVLDSVSMRFDVVAVNGNELTRYESAF